MGTRRATRVTRARELNGEAPQLATVQDLAGANAPLTGRQHPAQRSLARYPGTPKINLRQVAEACLEEGLDPATEIVRVLRGRPMVDDAGNEVIDPATGAPVMVHDVESDVRLRTLNSLLEFVQPKLKAVEVKMSGSLELSDEQLDARLKALIAKAAREA